MPNKSKPVPPTSRRSARQERLAGREANRQLARAGSRSSGGGDIKILILWTVAALAIGAIVIGGANSCTKPPSKDSLPSPIVPRVLTPADVPADGMTLGRADAPVTLDLYSDYQCPGCLAFAMEMEPKVIDEYVRPGKVKLVMHDFVVVDRMVGGTESRDAANAAQCAKDQGKFWPYHDWLFSSQFGEGVGSYTKDRLKYIGAQLGLDAGRFDKCVDEGQYDDQIATASEAAPSAVDSTPTIMVAGKEVSNAKNPGYVPRYEDIKAAIEAALNPAASPSASASASASATASPS